MEPGLCAVVLTVMTWNAFGIHSNETVLRSMWPARCTLAQILAPIFGFAAVSFAAYTIGVMARPIRALLSTYAPIYIVDGYLRYTTEHPTAGRRASRVEVLTHDRSSIAYWRTQHLLNQVDGIYPALIEFSRYGGILRIDGRAIDPPLRGLAPYGIGTFSGAARTGPL